MEDSNVPEDFSDEDKIVDGSEFAIHGVVVIAVACVGIPLSLVAIYSLYKEVKDDNVAPVYLINLLVSDLIQMCSSLGELLNYQMILDISYEGSLSASVGFMMCIAVERYLLVAFPLWYRFKRNIRNSVIVSLLVWLLSVIVAMLPHLIRDPRATVAFAVFLLLPFPVLIFSLFGTLKALLAAISVSRKEKQRIVTVLVLVLLNYMLLLLPFTMWRLKYVKQEDTQNHLVISQIFLRLNPLVNLLLYVVMRRGTLRKLQLTLRCCRETAADQPSPAVTENPAAQEEGEEGGACQGAPPSPQPSACSTSVCV